MQNYVVSSISMFICYCLISYQLFHLMKFQTLRLYKVLHHHNFEGGLNRGGMFFVRILYVIFLPEFCYCLGPGMRRLDSTGRKLCCENI